MEDGTKVPALCMEFASTVEAMEGDVDLQSVQNMVMRNVSYYHLLIKSSGNHMIAFFFTVLCCWPMKFMIFSVLILRKCLERNLKIRNLCGENLNCHVMFKLPML